MEGLESGQFLGDDGAFQPDWRNDAFPGDENKEIRENKTLSNIGDIRSMARQVVSGESTIGKLSGGRDFAILPNEHSTPEELDQFHTKMGRPSTSAEYEYSKIEGANPKFVEKMEAALHTAGVSKTAAEAIAKAYGEFGAEDAASVVTEQKIADAKGDKAIRDRLGSAYDAEMANANLAITALAAKIDPKFASDLTEDIKYDSNAQQLLSAVGKLIAEDPGLSSATGSANFTPSDARAKATDIINNNPYYLSPEPAGKPRNKQAHEAAIAEVQQLFEMANS